MYRWLSLFYEHPVASFARNDFDVLDLASFSIGPIPIFRYSACFNKPDFDEESLLRSSSAPSSNTDNLLIPATASLPNRADHLLRPVEEN